MMLGGARSTAVRGKGIKLCIVLFFKIDFSLFCVCVCVLFVCAHVYILNTCLVPVDTNWSQIPWNWNYMWLSVRAGN